MADDGSSAPGLWASGPPSGGGPRLRRLLGTREAVACVEPLLLFWGSACGQPATRIWWDGAARPQPLCEDCASYRAGPEGGWLARCDENGLWRPTHRDGPFADQPLDFDW